MSKGWAIRKGIEMDTTALLNLATGVADAIDNTPVADQQVYFTGRYVDDQDCEFPEARPRKTVPGALVRVALARITREIRDGVAAGELRLSPDVWAALHCEGLQIEWDWWIYSSPLSVGPVMSAAWQLAVALRDESDEDVVKGLQLLADANRLAS